MSSESATAPVTGNKPLSRGEKTRQRILSAAVEIFAKEGFDAARMEDIAATVGIKRAGLFYYYKDKQALYAAMLDYVISQLSQAIHGELNPELTLHEQIENCAVAWVDYVWHKPNLAKILLREGAKPSASLQSEITSFVLPLINLLQELLEQAKEKGEFQNPGVDALHIAGTLAGSTLFSRTVFPALLPELSADLSNNQRCETHKEDIRRLTRFLLSGG